MKWKTITAMVCITALEVVAMLKGIDGAIFGIVVAALAGLGGYEVRNIITRFKGG